MVSRVEVQERMTRVRREQDNRKRLERLRRDALRKSAFLRGKLVIDAYDTYALVKWFFQEFLDKRYQFTIQELRAELRQVYVSNLTRQDAADLLTALQHIEYADMEYTREQLIALLLLFERVVSGAVHSQAGKKPMFVRFKEFFTRGEEEPQTVITDLPVTEERDPARVLLLTLVERCYAALDQHDLRRARAAYQQLLTEYGRLPQAEQRRHYIIVDQAYRDLQNRTR